MKYLRHIFHTITSWEPATQTQAFFAMLGTPIWTVRRVVALYARLVRMFRAKGASWREAFVFPLAVPALVGGSTWINDLKSVIGGMGLKIAAYTSTQTG